MAVSVVIRGASVPATSHVSGVGSARTMYGSRQVHAVGGQLYEQHDTHDSQPGLPPSLAGPHSGTLFTMMTAEAPASSALRAFVANLQSPRSTMMMGLGPQAGFGVMGSHPVLLPGVPYTMVPVMEPARHKNIGVSMVAQQVAITAAERRRSCECRVDTGARHVAGSGTRTSVRRRSEQRLGVHVQAGKLRWRCDVHG